MGGKKTVVYWKKMLDSFSVSDPVKLTLEVKYLNGKTETDSQNILSKCAWVDGVWLVPWVFIPAHNNTAAVASLSEDKGQAFVWALYAMLCVGKQNRKISRKAKNS